MVGVVKSCCQHSFQDVHQPSPATVPSQGISPDKTASTRSRLSRHGRWELSLPCCQFERRCVGAGGTPPHTTHLLPHSLCLSRASPGRLCCRDTAPCPAPGRDSHSSPGTRGHAGCEQVERPGQAARARAPGGHSGFVCPCTVWEAPPAWQQKVSAFQKTIVFTLSFWKNKGRARQRHENHPGFFCLEFLLPWAPPWLHSQPLTCFPRSSDP